MQAQHTPDYKTFYIKNNGSYTLINHFVSGTCMHNVIAFVECICIPCSKSGAKYHGPT